MIGSFSKELINEYTAKGYWGTSNYVDRLKKHVRERPDAEAIVDSIRRVTFREFGEIANRLAKHFLDLGIRKGEIVGIQLPNVAEFHFVRYALSAIGAITLPIGLVYREKELKHVLGSAQAVAIVIPQIFHKHDYGQMLKAIQKDLPNLKHIIVTGKDAPKETISLEALMTQKIKEESPLSYLDASKSDPNAVDLLLMTSGTTGLPKLVMITPNAWLNHVGTVTMKILRAASDDIVLALPPITGGAGYNNCLGHPIVSGAKVLLQERFDADGAVELMKQEMATLVAAVPTQAIKILNVLEKHDSYKLKDIPVRVWLSVGAYLPVITAKTIEEKLGCRVVNIFGAVEAAVIAGNEIDDTSESRYTTVGRCIEGTQIKLIDENGLEVPTGEVGELFTRQPGIAVGYFGDPQATQKVFGIDGWVRTGDYALLDENQYLRIQGRKKDTISRGAMKISAEEIEDLLRAHPKILDVAIVGMPDPVLGEKSCAYIIAREGQDVTLEELVGFLKDRKVAKFKLPERLEVVFDFPYSAGFKVQKNVLREDIRCKLEKESKV